jgi:ATP-binding cassette subfamily F protein uup
LLEQGVVKQKKHQPQGSAELNLRGLFLRIDSPSLECNQHSLPLTAIPYLCRVNYLRAENLSRTYGDRTLFKDLTVSIEKGQRLALVARNGAGKTNLLEILAGVEEPDSGSVLLSKDITMAYLPQQPAMPAGESVWDNLFNSNNVLLATVSQYEKLLREESTDPNYLSRLQSVMDKMDALQAWDYEARVKQILSVFRITDYEQDVASLSGGQQKRLALARILILQPDFIIMDEPTNHLDLDMIEWLEGYFKSTDTTLLMVTHDRYFLDAVCNHILELADGTLYTHKGNYANFVEKRADRIAHRQKESEKASNLMRKELEWMRRQPKARGTKSKSRIEAFYELQEKAKFKQDDKQVELATQMQRLGGKILEVIGLQKAFATPQGPKSIVNDFTYLFKPGERVGIVGRNGVGKSTFINMLLGIEKPDAGSVIKGDTVVFGYYSQAGMKFTPGKRVLETVQDIAEYIEMARGEKITATQLCKRFLFDDKMQHTFVEKLSGGEKRRLFLLTILMRNPNFLVLDEPTNDLDIDTLNVLEDFLENFKGCLMMVTHDRYFMDKVVDHLLVFEGDGVIKDFNGNYQDYLDEQQLKKYADTAQKQGVATATSTPPQAKSEKKKPSYKEKRAFEELTIEMQQLESRKKELELKLGNAQLPVDEIATLGTELQNITNLLDEKTMQWLELSELMED